MTDSKRVIALGFFDGVHRGHAALLERTKQRAAELGVLPSVLSFDVHPDTLVFGHDVPLINISADPAPLKDGGRLCDIAPTMLKLMGLEIPEEMTGTPLV